MVGMGAVVLNQWRTTGSFSDTFIAEHWGWAGKVSWEFYFGRMQGPTFFVTFCV